MRCVLVGHPGSQHIVKASRYLTNKYLPGFDVVYLNNVGRVMDWSNFIADYLTTLEDKHIIFALDDYLLSGPIDMDIFNKAVDKMSDEVVCIKLCKSTPEEHEAYPVTTQYCIWDREYLISLLRKINTPWEFEMVGSKLFDKKVLLQTCLDYPCNSSLSERWDGIKTEGNNPEDIKFLKENGYL